MDQQQVEVMMDVTMILPRSPLVGGHVSDLLMEVLVTLVLLV
jgi:hypothetical protein